MYFILASYNAGLNKVMKYRELALQHGRNPNVWSDNVERYCPKQTIAFVRDITNRYSHYKTIIE
jgi:membrane-bound lytic murein transglycosylase MltF